MQQQQQRQQQQRRRKQSWFLQRDADDMTPQLYLLMIQTGYDDETPKTEIYGKVLPNMNKVKEQSRELFQSWKKEKTHISGNFFNIIVLQIIKGTTTIETVKTLEFQVDRRGKIKLTEEDHPATDPII